MANNITKYATANCTMCSAARIVCSNNVGRTGVTCSVSRGPVSLAVTIPAALSLMASPFEEADTDAVGKAVDEIW